MTQPAGFRKNRLEALQDGIFAVALTLLALDLRVPAGLALSDVPARLVNLLPALGVYAVTFAFIIVVWLYVYSFQEVVIRQDLVGSTLALAASACVALLPFTSSTFANYPDVLMAGHFFVRNILAIIFVYLVYVTYAKQRLIPKTVEQRLPRAVTVSMWLSLIYIAIIDIVCVPYHPTWILPAVVAGFAYAYSTIFVLHSRFVAAHEHVRSIDASG